MTTEETLQEREEREAEEDFQREMQAMRAEYDREKAAAKVGGKISLIRKESEIKGGYWKWECELEMPDGTIKTGFIPSDGFNHDSRYFEPDE